MMTKKAVWRLSLFLGVLLLVGTIIGLALSQNRPRMDVGEKDTYRVEMVNNDPYKVQTGLNLMAKEGWYYVSSINRTDGKVLLIFRKGNW